MKKFENKMKIKWKNYPPSSQPAPNTLFFHCSRVRRGGFTKDSPARFGFEPAPPSIPLPSARC